MNAAKKRRPKLARLPGLSDAESAKLYHAVGKIDDLERPVLSAQALILEARGIVRALGNARALKALEQADAALSASEVTEMAHALAARGHS